MKQGTSWEEECLPTLHVRNRTGDLALCVLWNLLEKVTPNLPSSDQFPRLSVIGNLRSPLGLSWFIRGLWRLPNVQTVLIWGGDLTRTGEALLRLWEKGLDEGHRVPEFGWQLNRHIIPDGSLVEEIRKLVDLWDLRGKRLRDLPGILPTIPQKFIIREQKELPPVPVPERQILPSRGATTLINAKDPADGWLQVLNFVMQCGNVRATRKGETIAHYFNILVTMPVLNEQEEIRVCFGCPDKTGPFDFTLSDFEDYYKSFILSVCPEGVEYTYGQRAQNWRGHNQLQEVIQRLRESPDTKRATIVFLEVPDLAELEDAPCLTHTTYSISEGRLHSTAVYRSHDMYQGWPYNVLALLRLHRHVAAELADLGVSPGTFTMLSENAQIYKNYWDKAVEKIQRWQINLEKMPVANYDDPAGNFIFSIRGGVVRAILTNPIGDEIIWQVEHKNPKDLMRWIVETMPHLRRDHLLYLGQEMEKLRRSLEEGTPYVQG